jgi:hypothetical protein
MSGTYEMVKGGKRLAFLLALALATAPACGCATLPASLYHETAPVGVPCQLATRWDNGVRETCDTVNGGDKLRGLSGRLYLLDDQCHFVSDEATVIADLFDDRPLATGNPPVHLEQWVIPPEVFKMLLRKDGVGWGYTLFLPWMNSYRPEITQVHLRICHKDANGTPMYTVSSTINLGDPNAPPGQVVAKANAARPAAPVAPQPPVQPTAAPTTGQAAYPTDMPPPLQIPLRRNAPPVVPASAQTPAPSAVTMPALTVTSPYAPATDAATPSGTQGSWAGRAK